MYAPPRERTAAALGAGAIVLGMAVMLVLGLRVDWHRPAVPALISLDLPQDRPLPRPTPPPERKPALTSAPKDAAAPPGRKAEAAQVVAAPVIPLIIPPPVPVAPVAGTGSAAAQGAAQTGSGQGTGGAGDGTGGGGGLGGNGTGMPETGPRQIRGNLSWRDLPADVLGPGQQARVGVRYTVEVDGRVSRCIADRPSGYPQADALACQLIEQRFIFRPARDGAGRPVRSVIAETHTWFSRAERE